MNQIQKMENQSLSTAHFNDIQIELIKNSICKGASNDELQFFIMACQRTGLDPFAKQIYSVPRGGQRTIQTSVDGFRLIADRTGRYAPGKEPTFEYDKNGHLLTAISYVKKQTADGTWHEVSASANFDEYNANTPLWKKMPRAMLSKCAECLALRKCFPAEMSGVYGKEEMDQAEVVDVKPLYIPKISINQSVELNQLLNGCSEKSKQGFNGFMKTGLKIDSLDDLPLNEFDRIKAMLKQRFDENQAELLEAEMSIRGEE